MAPFQERGKDLEREQSCHLDLHMKRLSLRGEKVRVAEEPLNPKGFVMVNGQHLTAEALHNAYIPARAWVQVVEVHVAVLFVKLIG